MLKAYNTLVKPSQARLEKSLRVKHIKVTPLDKYWDNYVPVTVDYILPSGKKTIVTARYIQEMKALGVLPS